jgi:hypothetical protein
VEHIDPSVARHAAIQAIQAIQAISIGLGAGTFAPILGINDVKDIAPVMQLWRRGVGLLSKCPEA